METINLNEDVQITIQQTNNQSPDSKLICIKCFTPLDCFLIILILIIIVIIIIIIMIIN
jgi:hypothetical protein